MFSRHAGFCSAFRGSSRRAGFCSAFAAYCREFFFVCHGTGERSGMEAAGEREGSCLADCFVLSQRGTACLVFPFFLVFEHGFARRWGGAHFGSGASGGVSRAAPLFGEGVSAYLLLSSMNYLAVKTHRRSPRASLAYTTTTNVPRRRLPIDRLISFILGRVGKGKGFSQKQVYLAHFGPKTGARALLMLP